MDNRIQLLDRLKLQLGGYVYLGEKMKVGWKEALPHYAFNCPSHGLVETYVRGHRKKLICPKCENQEKLKKSAQESKSLSSPEIPTKEIVDQKPKA
jgi:hypothetical protein